MCSAPSSLLHHPYRTLFLGHDRPLPGEGITIDLSVESVACKLYPRVQLPPPPPLLASSSELVAGASHTMACLLVDAALEPISCSLVATATTPYVLLVGCGPEQRHCMRAKRLRKKDTECDQLTRSTPFMPAVDCSCC